MLDWWSRLSEFIRRPVPAALMFIAIAILDPFGLRSASDRASEGIILRFLAPFYRSDDQRITVVLFDDASVRALGSHWPPDYNVTVNLLRQVSCAEPRAVFVDLLFTYQHEPDRPSAFENLVQHLSGDRGCPSDAPIYVADMADQHGFDVPGNSVVLERLRQQAEGQSRLVRRVPVNWVAPQGLYPLALRVKDPSTWEPSVVQGGYLPTPAFALYQVANPGADLGDFIHPMVVRWGFTPQEAPPSDIASAEACDHVGQEDEAPSLMLNWRAALAQVGRDLVRVFDEPGMPRQRCPYSFYVRAYDALKGGSSRAGGPLHDLFHGRYVLIGTSVAGLGDVTVSPVHGQLPGVFLHAMALDNLLRFHNRYWRPMPQLADRWPLSEVESGAVLEVLLFLGLLALNVRVFKPWRVRCRNADRIDWARGLEALELVLVLLIVLIAILLLARFHYSPINWLGLIALWFGTTLAVSEESKGASHPAVTRSGPEPASSPAKEHHHA